MAASNGIGLGQTQSGIVIPKNQGRKRDAKNLSEEFQNSATINKINSVVSTDPSLTRSIGLQHRAVLNAQQRIDKAKVKSTDELADTGEERVTGLLGFPKV